MYKLNLEKVSDTRWDSKDGQYSILYLEGEYYGCKMVDGKAKVLNHDPNFKVCRKDLGFLSHHIPLY